MKKIQKKTEELANLCLDNGSTFNSYTDEDFFNSTLIFSHFLMDMVFKEKQNLPFQDLCGIAEKSGSELRKLILEVTGKDTWKLASQEMPSKKIDDALKDAVDKVKKRKINI